METITLSVTVVLDSAAFDDEVGGVGARERELARIVRDIGEQVEMGATSAPIRDINGKRAGDWELK